MDTRSTSPRDESSQPTAGVLAHVGWIRSLARHLVADPHLAEDLVQDTCVVALERPPTDPGKARRWLASVMRNALRQRLRGDFRRSLREEENARSEALEPTSHLVERVAVQRQVVDAVLALREPYRSVILLRYFEDLPPREIAKQLDSPIATVTSQLQRGLALLREKLDAAHGGDRRAWSLLLVPGAGRFDPAGATTLGSLLVNTKLVVACAALVVAGTTLAVVSSRDGQAQASSGAEEIVASEPLVESNGEAPRAEASQSGVRVAVSSGEEDLPQLAASEPVDQGQSSFSVWGRVLDGNGNAVPGIALRSESGEVPVTTSGADGRFEFAAREDRGRLLVADERWVTVRAGVWQENAHYSPVVMIAPAIDLGGVVVDEDGRSLSDVRMRLEPPLDFPARFDDILDASTLRHWTALTGSEGEFHWDQAPAIPGSTIWAVSEGYAHQKVLAPTHTDTALRMTLARPDLPLTGVLRGRVVDRDGAGVDGARVALGVASASTDASGDFELDLRFAVTSDELRAVKEGFQPSSLARPETASDDSTGWPDFVVVELHDAPLAIRGRAIDYRGEPLARARVWLAEPTRFGVVGVMPVMSEYLAAGGAVPLDAIESKARRPAVDGDDFNDIVRAASGPPDAFWFWVETDENGGFEVGGLSNRHYRLCVLHPEELTVHTSDPIHAGHPGANRAVIQLPKPDVYDRVAGRVTTVDGQPLPGVRLRPWIALTDERARVFGGSMRVALTRSGGFAVTDSEGRFVLHDVPREGVSLSLKGDAILPASVALEGVDQPRSMEIVAHTRCHVQVELREPHDRYDAIAFRDEEGRPLEVMRLSENTVNAFTDVPILNGASAVVSVSSEARQLVFLSKGEELDVLPITLSPIDVNHVVH